MNRNIRLLFCRSESRLPTFLGGVCLSVFFLLGSGLLAARAAGRIEGHVFDAKTNDPLAYANVIVVGTTFGAMTQSDGGFVITPLEPGSYEIQATFVGYETMRETVALEEGETLQIRFRMKPTEIRAREVTIRADRPLVDVKKASTIRSFTDEEIEALALQPTIDSIVEQLPGVTKDNNELFIRGGRADETLYVIDGVAARDLISGESRGKSVHTRSVAQVEVITGGFDARHGQALSGIVNVKLKEGTEDFHGFLGWTTDRLVDNQEYDSFAFELSGPVFSEKMRLPGLGRTGPMTFFLTLTGTARNGWLPSISDLDGDRHLRSSYRDGAFGADFRYERFFYPREFNEWHALLKSGWRISKSDKLSFTFTKFLAFDQGFERRALGDLRGDISMYPYNWRYNLDNYYTMSEDQNFVSIAWNRGLSPTVAQTVKLTRNFTSLHQDVRGQSWDTFNKLTDTSLPPEENDPYFVDIGDAPIYHDRFSEVWSLSADWSAETERHRFDWGLSHNLETVQFIVINTASIDSVLKPLGNEFDLYKVYPATGAIYIQDRLEYQSLVASLGLRYDYWFPGELVERTYDDYENLNRPTINATTRQEFLDDTHGVFGRRFKGHLSPRLKVSHPITNHSHLFFNYGHFSQNPTYYYAYAKLGSQSSEEFPLIGNPNLNPEIQVQYELGAGHEFRPDLSVKTTLFNKDTYDYPAARGLTFTERRTVRSNFLIYLNQDYARTAGIELELRKKRLQHWSGSASYTYAAAKGKSSDPFELKVIQSSGGDAREDEPSESYVRWNRPHKFTLSYALSYGRGEKVSPLGVESPFTWDLSLYSLLRSGRAYTPMSPTGERIGQLNSENGPWESKTDLKLRSRFSLLGLGMQLSLEVFNLFNQRTAKFFDWSTGKAFELGKGSLDTPYTNSDNLLLSDEELVELAGRSVGPDESYALVAEEIRELIRSAEKRYSDPSLRVDPRTIRISAGVEW